MTSVVQEHGDAPTETQPLTDTATTGVDEELLQQRQDVEEGAEDNAGAGVGSTPESLRAVEPANGDEFEDILPSNEEAAKPQGDEFEDILPSPAKSSTKSLSTRVVGDLLATKDAPGDEEEQRQVMAEVADDDAAKGNDFPEGPLKRSCAERLTGLWIERRDELSEDLSLAGVFLAIGVFLRRGFF
jgi:hypothetical protein